MMNNRLKELRLAKKMTQQELADALHTTKANVCMIENNKRNLTASSVLIFANYFGVSTDYLLGNTEKMNNLKKLRLQRRLTLEELSEKVNISKSVLSYLENEVRPFTQEHMEILSNYFNVSIDYLLGNTNNTKLQAFEVADQDGSLTKVQHELIDATKGLTVEDMQEICKYIDYIKSKKGNK